MAEGEPGAHDVERRLRSQRRRRSFSRWAVSRFSDGGGALVAGATGRRCLRRSPSLRAALRRGTTCRSQSAGRVQRAAVRSGDVVPASPSRPVQVRLDVDRARRWTATGRSSCRVRASRAVDACARHWPVFSRSTREVSGRPRTRLGHPGAGSRAPTRAAAPVHRQRARSRSASCRRGQHPDARSAGRGRRQRVRDRRSSRWAVLRMWASSPTPARAAANCRCTAIPTW